MPKQREHSEALVEAVAAFIDRHGLLSPGQSVLVAVSGGADSVALLAVLNELAKRSGRAYRLTVAHLDHSLREGSAGDATFVADLCERLDVPRIARRMDVAQMAAERGVGIEEAARDVRYAFLARAAGDRGATAVAVGHHADDNVETILHRIVRGTHLRGLAGMPVRRVLGEGVELVRPLLAARREDIEAFCRRRQLTWRADPSNTDTGFLRNFIRHEVLPLLRRHANPCVDEALLRLAAAAGEAEAFLAGQAADAARRAGLQTRAGAATLDAGALAEAPPVVAACVVRDALERLGVPMGQVTRDQLVAVATMGAQTAPPCVNLPGGFVARRRGDELALGPATSPQNREQWQTQIHVPGETVLPDGRRVFCELGPFEESSFRAHCTARRGGVEMIDADRLAGRLACRPRRNGDAFVPLGMRGRQTVGDFLTNRKVPAAMRKRVLCLLDDAGIVYVAPFQIADRVRVRRETRRVLRIELRVPDEPVPQPG